jgi:hypothetical protein
MKPMRHLLLAVLSPAILFTNTTLGQQSADPDREVTAFIAPLRQQHQKIKALHQKIHSLGRASTSQKEFRDHALLLYTAAAALDDTLEAFFAGRSRRGTLEELDLVGQSMTMVTEATSRLWSTSGVALPIETFAADAPRRVADLAGIWANAKLVQELRRGGIHALLEPFHADQLKDALRRSCFKNLFGLESEQDFKKEMEGFAFQAIHRVDRNLAEAFFRRQLEHQIRKRIILELVVNISSHTLVVRLAEQTVWNLAVNELLPKMRETLRKKGDLEERVLVSLATLEASALDLNRLGAAKEDARTLPLKEVREALDEAQGRIKATRYLMKDLAHARQVFLQFKMERAQKDLERTMKHTRFRFLLHRDEDVDQLRPDFVAYRPYPGFLKRLIKAMETEDKRFFITHVHQLPSERLAPRSAPCPAAHLEAVPSFQFVDMKQVEKLRLQHLAAGKPLEEFNPYGFLQRWEPVHQLFKVVHGDRTLYHYVAVNASASDRRDYGNRAFLFGLPEGNLPLQVNITTHDGRIFGFYYTLVVAYSNTMPGTEERIRKDLRLLEERRAAVSKARDAKEKRTAELGVLTALMNYRSSAKWSASANRGELQNLQNEIFNLYKNLRTPMEVNNFRKVGLTLLDECRLLADEPSYKLALKILRQIETYYGDAMPDDPYARMAHLTMAWKGDIPATRRYMEKAIERRETLGLYRMAPEKKQRDLDLLPRVPF